MSSPVPWLAAGVIVGNAHYLKVGWAMPTLQLIYVTEDYSSGSSFTEISGYALKVLIDQASSVAGKRREGKKMSRVKLRNYSESR
jgi:hypothetical protein